MDDAEISRRLALAIGWEHVKESPARIRALVSETGNMWHAFDYRAPAVIWPIAERFNCFPQYYTSTKTWACSPAQWAVAQDADTAAKAVALTVIKHHEGIKT